MTDQRPVRKSGPLPPFPPVTAHDHYEEEPLKGNPAFFGGLLHSDHPLPEGTTVNIETKEIQSAPRTEDKDMEVKSGTRREGAPIVRRDSGKSEDSK